MGKRGVKPTYRDRTQTIVHLEEAELELISLLGLDRSALLRQALHSTVESRMEGGALVFSDAVEAIIRVNEAEIARLQAINEKARALLPRCRIRAPAARAGPARTPVLVLSPEQADLILRAAREEIPKLNFKETNLPEGDDRYFSSESLRKQLALAISQRVNHGSPLTWADIDPFVRQLLTKATPATREGVKA